ncbi:MAG: hypothetical protein MMC33_005836 [Icmadophila ericetorum]|nr:hypothetical protein [Icmadophila ericetorum]
MSYPIFTKTYHKGPYPAIDPRQPKLSAAGKTIVISGGGKGVGLAIAKSFAIASAANIVIFGRNENDLAKGKAEIEKSATSTETKVHTFVADVLDKEALDRNFSNFAQSTGLIDIFVNNVGQLAPFAKAAEVDPTDTFWKDFEINVKGSLFATQAFIRNANKDKEPVYLNVSAGAAHTKYRLPWSSYAASKAAFIRTVDHIEVENPWLRVHQIHPGVFKTGMTSSLDLSNDSNEGGYWEDIEIAGNFSVWLTSPEGAFLKGKFVWAGWDAEEMKAREKEIISNPNLLTFGLIM